MKVRVIVGLLAVSLTLPAFARGGGHSGGHAGGHASSRASSYTGGHSHSFAVRSSRASGRDHSVRSYVKNSGTVVQSHHATNRDATKQNNYSTRGNVNPYTGVAGTKNPG